MKDIEYFGRRPRKCLRASIARAAKEVLEDPIMKEVTKQTLWERPKDCCCGCPALEDIKFSLIAWIAFAVYLGFVLFYILLFGLTYGETVILDYVRTFFVSQALGVFTTEPVWALGTLIYLLIFLPMLFRWIGWMPCMHMYQGNDLMESNSPLAGRLEVVTLPHAAAAASGMDPAYAIVVYQMSEDLGDVLLSGRDRKAGVTPLAEAGRTMERRVLQTYVQFRVQTTILRMLALERRALKLIGKKREELRARADASRAAGGHETEDERQVLIRLERAIGLRREAWKTPTFRLHLGVAHAPVEHALMGLEEEEEEPESEEKPIEVTVDESKGPDMAGEAHARLLKARNLIRARRERDEELELKMVQDEMMVVED